MPKPPWHKNTRYWKLGGETILLGFLALFATMIWRPDAIGNIATMLTVIVPVIFGGTAYVKGQETKVNGS